jgi:hypothetical protein
MNYLDLQISKKFQKCIQFFSLFQGMLSLNFMNIASFVNIAFIAFCRKLAFYSNMSNKGLKIYCTFCFYFLGLVFSIVMHLIIEPNIKCHKV